MDCRHFVWSILFFASKSATVYLHVSKEIPHVSYEFFGSIVAYERFSLALIFDWSLYHRRCYHHHHPAVSQRRKKSPPHNLPNHQDPPHGIIHAR